MRGASNSVSVRCEGRTAWTVYVPVRVRDLRPVLVLARAVRRGEPIDAGMLRAETRDVAQLPFGYLTELSSVAASEFRRPVGAGQVVSPDRKSTRLNSSH